MKIFYLNNDTCRLAAAICADYYGYSDRLSVFPIQPSDDDEIIHDMDLSEIANMDVAHFIGVLPSDDSLCKVTGRLRNHTTMYIGYTPSFKGHELFETSNGVWGTSSRMLDIPTATWLFYHQRSLPPAMREYLMGNARAIKKVIGNENLNIPDPLDREHWMEVFRG